MSRICDFGMTLMRLTYSYELSTAARQQIFDNILINNGVGNDAGNLYLDARLASLYESILQFVGCVQKVCNMRYWSREITRAVFYDDLRDYVTAEMIKFPQSRISFHFRIFRTAWIGLLHTAVGISMCLECWATTRPKTLRFHSWNFRRQSCRSSVSSFTRTCDATWEKG